MPENPATPPARGGAATVARTAAGHFAVAGLRALGLLPAPLAARLLPPLLPAYPRLRPAQARRLAALFAASPFGDRLDLAGYYRRRLDLLHGALRLHGSPASPDAVETEGAHRYGAALDSGRPVALLGLHMGLAELLHRVPVPPRGRPFRILTAPAFAPPLTEWLRRGREADGKRVLENRGVGPGLRETLSRRGVLACMVDQHPGRPETWARLWGRVEVPVPARLVRLLADRGCVLLPVSTRLLSAPGRPAVSLVRFHAPWEPGEVAGAGAAEARIGAFLESAISVAPDQWNWSYPKNRVAPET